MKEQHSGYQESPWSVFVAGGSSSKAGEFVFASSKESDAVVGYTGGNDDSDSFDIPFFKSLGIIFGVSILVLTIIAIYFSFCQGDDDEAEYDDETGLSPRGVLKGKRNGMLLDGSFLTQGWTDEQALEETERVELPRMSEFEVELYQRAKEFRTMNPPMIKAFGTYMNSEDRQFIKDRGIQAYYLLPSINDNIDVDGNFLPSFFIQDKLNITFTKYNRSSSSIMNYPLPNNRRDAVYFEVKVFKFKNNFLSNSIFSVGLVTCPYPYFVMPGRSQYSIAYESTGKLRINNAFYANTLLPKLQEGDVVGMGYRFRSGTIFITHNGKKLMDLTQNIGIELFVGIGAMNASYTRTYTREGLIEDIDNVDLRNDLLEAELNQKRDVSEILSEKLSHVYDPRHEPVDSDEIELHVNLGNLGFVFVEANVKKYAFGSIYGDIGIPPAYNGDETKKDVLLQKGDDLPPLYPEDENGFFGNIKVNTGKKSLFVEMPEDTWTRQGSSESSQLISKYERSPTAASQNDYSSLLNDIDEDNSATPLLSKKQVRIKSHRSNKRRSRKRTD